jgi:drug/metabolite transporter (DMT)-like permease
MPFAVFILLVGGAPVAIRIGYAEMAPFWMGVARFGLGALVFWGLAIYKGLKLPQGRGLVGAVLYGVLSVGISIVLISWGLVKTPASLASILLALVPLMTLLLSSLQGVESLSWRGVLGSLLAIGGTAIAVGGATSGDISLPHIGAIILATAFSAQSSVVIKRFPPNPPIMTNAISMTVGSIILGIASLVTGEAWVIPSQTNTWVAFGYLLIFVTILAFILYLQVLGRWTASGTSYGFVVIPLVTVIVAAVLTEENITASFLVGAVLVIAGVLVGALLPSKDKTEAVEECKDRSGQVLPRCY